MKILFAIIAILIPAAAMANAGVSLDSKIFVEHQEQDASGNVKTLLEPVETAKTPPGSNLVFVLSYRNGSGQPAENFVITNPLPEAVAYAGHEGEAPQVSIDGGKSWGQLADLKIVGIDGTERAAQPSDVTHVRWTFATAIPAGQSGKLSFRGVVK